MSRGVFSVCLPCDQSPFSSAAHCLRPPFLLGRLYQYFVMKVFVGYTHRDHAIGYRGNSNDLDRVSLNWLEVTVFGDDFRSTSDAKHPEAKHPEAKTYTVMMTLG